MSRNTPRPALADSAAAAVTPPRLAIDALLATLVVVVFGYVVAGALTPDGVAYLENAELIAAGRTWQALQGYWSPGYSLLMVPAVWMARGDRSTLLALAHGVQIALALTAIWLGVAVVRRRVPVAAQRAVFWTCLWVVLRWLSQELLTPDLLLGVSVLGVLACLPAVTTRDGVTLGVLVGLAFLAKTSIWPSLAVAGGAMIVHHWKAPRWPRPTTVSMTVAALIAATFVIPLSVKVGHVTLGGVGSLNAGWYLGDLNQRTPDVDQRFHEARRSALLPSGETIEVYEMPPGTATYAPWARPEEWATGFRASEQPTWNAAQAKIVWKLNGLVALRWLLPLVAGALALRWMTRGANRRAIRPLLDWPVAAVGAAGAAAFLVVHAEARLLAPSALLLLFAAWPEPVRRGTTLRTPLLAAVFAGALALHIASDLWVAAERARSRAMEEHALRAHLTEKAASHTQRNVVLVGPFGPWVAILWEYRLRVQVQIGEQAGAKLAALPANQRLWWIRDRFGRSIVGVADATTRTVGASTRNELVFTSF
ncbi:MAG: hypothetical protein HYV19_03755 [Gemmatimonadetes bacterium]|nr:hypothetical protein [Gemmatimonadota bacterium]